MDYDNCRSLPAMFFEQAERGGDKPFLWAKRGGRYEPISWAAAARDVRRLAHGLTELGIGHGDRVALVAENRPEWVIADFAIMSAGAITVPAYVTNTVEDYRHVFATSGAKAVIVSRPPLSARVLAAANQAETVKSVIAIEPAAGQASAVDLLAWNDLLAKGDETAAEITTHVAELAPDDIACLIFTSGTGGIPKGVMTTHRNILANCRGAFRLLETLGLGAEVFLNFLPLSHSYEHTAGMMFPISLGAQIYFAEGAETLPANLLETRPTIMTAVPRLYETMHRRIMRGVERKGKIARKMFDKAVEIGRKRAEEGVPNLTERLVDPLLDRMVREDLKAAFWRPPQGDGVGGCGAQPGDRQLFSGARCQIAAGLRPDRSWTGHCLQPANADQDRHCRPATRWGFGAHCRRWRDPGCGRQCHERLLERSAGHVPGAGRRLAPYRRCRPDRSRWLYPHHRPQARLYQEFGRRDDLSGPDRGLFDIGAGDRTSNGVWRPPALSGRGAGSRRRIHRKFCRRKRRAHRPHRRLLPIRGLRRRSGRW